MKTKYDILDIAKIILAIMVVAIHANPLGRKFGQILNPFLRIAVPIFFMISSMLFFGKLGTNHEEKQSTDTRILLKYEIRLLKYYWLWFIILLPVTLWLRRYFVTGFIPGIKTIAVACVFSSTYRASWFISALIIGTMVVFCLDRLLGIIPTCIISAIIYLICCLCSNYYQWGESIPIVSWINSHYPPTIFNSFPVALIWISFGKIIADSMERILLIRKGVLNVCISISFVLLAFEEIFSRSFGYRKGTDCYVTLLWLCPLILIWLLKHNIDINNSIEFRKMSAVIFPVHASLASVLQRVFEKMHISVDLFPTSIIWYLSTLCISVICYYCIKWLYEKTHIKLIQYLM